MRTFTRELDRSKRLQRGQRGLRRFEQLVPARSVLSSSPREVDVVLGFGPGSLQLWNQVRPGGDDQQCVRWKNGANRRALRLSFADGDLSINGQDERQLRVATGALGHEIEVA